MAAQRSYTIAVMPGDGIGPEVLTSSLQVLQTVTQMHGLEFNFVNYDYGANLYAKTGRLITPEDMDAIRSSSDAIFAGAFGLPDVRLPNGTEVGPQIVMRDYYQLFASLRLTKAFTGVPTRLKAASGREKGDLDILIIRELTEGMFAGMKDPVVYSDEAMSDRMTITRTVSTKLFRLAFSQARRRKEINNTMGRVTLLHKSNNLRSNGLLQKVFWEIAALTENSDIEAKEHYIDAGAMYFVTDPERYDVVVTENIFGDIISDLAAGIVGGLGVAPSGDVNGPLAGSSSQSHATTAEEKPFGLFQPSHGTAPDIMGKGFANPIATVLSAVMMLEWLAEVHDDSRCSDAADRLKAAVELYFTQGPLTRDLGGRANTNDVSQRLLELLNQA